MTDPTTVPSHAPDPAPEENHSWETVVELLDAGRMGEVEAFLAELPPPDLARMLSRLDPEHRTLLLEQLEPERAAEIVEELSDAQAGGLIDDLPPEAAARILDELPANEQADLIGRMDEEEAEEILAEMAPEAAEETRRLAEYPPDTAGGLMETEFLAYPQQATCAEVVDDLRREAQRLTDEDVQYLFVVDRDRRLVGVLRVRDLLFRPPDRPVETFMIRDPIAVRVDAALDEIAEILDRHAFLGLPVVDHEGRLVGVVHRAAVEEALSERAESDHLKSQGIVGGEELRSMPLRVRSVRRLSWLSVNIVLNLMAASVIAAYQDTLSSVIALAVFLPIISDMSGCSGNQAVAVSMRELTLGLVRPTDVAWVWLREVGVGLLNGLVLGVLIALVAWLWKGNPYLGLVVGAALCLNTVFAVSVGGTVPLLLRRLGLDPALASGPVLTTLTDMCGFFLVLNLATWTLPKLTGA